MNQQVFCVIFYLTVVAGVQLKATAQRSVWRMPGASTIGLSVREPTCYKIEPWAPTLEHV